MINGIMGKKLGMTQVYTDKGALQAVTAIEAGPCTVTQIKTVDKEGYNAAQLGFGEARKRKAAKKELKGNAKYRHLREFGVDDAKSVEVGQKIDVSLFKAGDIINIIGVSKGKGFAGGVKRYHFGGGFKTHGQSDRWRSPGAIATNTIPGRILKGKRMAGHMGDVQVTAINLEVYQADPARNLLLVKGTVPGGRNGLLLINKSDKGKK
ncbi:MAG: 50S ribosomal protein L3 [Dehalococcoidales bacterium]|nr:50S ribosomal protein L3 [Dehalococcoidales bacterium]